MKITIVENELYLAQSIQNNLSEKLNAKCEIYGSYDEAIKTKSDIYIVNTNLNGNLKKFLLSKKDKIIILLVPYVTYETVMQPIELGADDYLQKPFSIEELIRKIKHLVEFYSLKEKIKLYQEFINFIFQDIELELPNYTFPIFIKSSINKSIEKFIFEISKKENIPIKIIDLEKFNENDFKSKNILYVCLNYDKVENKELLKKLSKYKTIFILPRKYDKIEKCIEFDTTIPHLLGEEILSIEEYIKFIITSYQYKFPDTELSKKLGISRKSLWEKRKKYGIFKQK